MWTLRGVIGFVILLELKKIIDMIKEETFTDIDIADIIEDHEHDSYMDSDALHTETDNGEGVSGAQDSELNSSEEQQSAEKRPHANKSEAIKPTRLPMARIKNIMKMDPDVNVISGDALFLVAKATEMFLETIVKETYAYTSTNKRKVISKKDLDLIINKVDCLCFLEGAMDF